MVSIQLAPIRRPQRRRAHPRWLGALVALALAATLPQALPATSEDTARGAPGEPGERVIVLVPGITGTALRDRESGEIAWGTGARLISPRDGGHALALPIAPTEEPARLEAFRVIEKIRLLKIFSKPVYGPIIDSFEARGYRHGQLHAPAEGENFLTFVYDWRFSNEAAVRQLHDQLDQLRRMRGLERLEVGLICQSNGAHICRYLAKYGAATFDEAEAGGARAPSWLDIRQMVLVGTSNGGSLRILREFDRGRRYVPLIGRQMQPETLFTFPSLFQDLPTYRRQLFLDADGEELDLDLFDARVWKAHGLSIFDPRAERRIARSPYRESFGTEAQRLEHLEHALRQARRLHALLARDVPHFADIRYELIQNRVLHTPERATLVEKRKAGWKLFFTGDPDIDNDLRLRRQATSLGDGHATVTSQGWLSAQEKERLGCPPLYVRGSHFTLILNPSTVQRLVDVLVDRELECPGDKAD